MITDALDRDDLADLLAEAPDGNDERRAALVIALFLARLDTNRDADLDRFRIEGPPPVRPF